MLTRIAPTPSGYLHMGNCLNFVITQHVATEWGLQLALRLDVDDRSRIRTAYIDDVHRIIEELGIHLDLRYPIVTDFESRWNDMWAALVAAQHRGLHMYRCECSRGQLAAGHKCTCHGRSDLHRHSNIKINAEPSELDSRFDGFTLWRKNDSPSSVLASILDDEFLGTTHIVRGEDLRFISDLERTIAPYFEARIIQAAQEFHHPLLTHTDGTKLSKSAGTQAHPLTLSAQQIASLREQADAFVRSIDFR
jgi:glutamyl/glutaminyl-tRNA synthetase